MRTKSNCFFQSLCLSFYFEMFTKYQLKNRVRDVHLVILKLFKCVRHFVCLFYFLRQGQHTLIIFQVYSRQGQEEEDEIKSKQTSLWPKKKSK